MFALTYTVLYVNCIVIQLGEKKGGSPFCSDSPRRYGNCEEEEETWPTQSYEIGGLVLIIAMIAITITTVSNFIFKRGNWGLDRVRDPSVVKPESTQDF